MSYYIKGPEDVARAVELFRLNYERYGRVRNVAEVKLKEQGDMA